MTKRYNILKAEYRSLAYRLGEALMESPKQFKKLQKELMPRMKLLTKEIDKELEAMEATYTAIAAQTPSVDIGNPLF